MSTTTSHTRVFGINGALTSRHFVLCAALLGLTVRMLLAVAARHNTVFPDELDYENLGTALWKIHQFALSGSYTAFRAPAEPFLICVVYEMFGRHPVIVKLITSLLLITLPFLCARLAILAGMDLRAAGLAALLGSLDPGLNYASTTLYPTALAAIAITAGIFYCARAFLHDDMSSAAIGGLSLAIAASAQTTFAPLPIIIAVISVWRGKLRIGLIIATIGMLFTVAWIGRNRLVMHTWALATNGGINLRLGANDAATPRSGNLITVPDISAKGEVEIDAGQRQEATKWIAKHPARYSELFLSRGLLVADSVGRPATRGMHDGIAAKLVGWTMLPIVLLGLAGLFVHRRWPGAWFTAAALSMVIITSALMMVKPRFRFPVDPVLGVFAAAMIVRLAGRSDGRGGCVDPCLASAALPRQRSLLNI